MTGLNNLIDKKTQIDELIMGVRKATGDAINDMLPKKLRDYGYRVLNLNEFLLTIYCKENDVMEQAILVRHGFGKDDGVFRMWIDKPQYFSKINLLMDTDAMVYYEVLTSIMTDKKFQTELAEKLKNYGLRMIEFKKDLEKVNAEIEKL